MTTGGSMESRRRCQVDQMGVVSSRHAPSKTPLSEHPTPGLHRPRPRRKRTRDRGVHDLRRQRDGVLLRAWINCRWDGGCPGSRHQPPVNYDGGRDGWIEAKCRSISSRMPNGNPSGPCGELSGYTSVAHPHSQRILDSSLVSDRLTAPLRMACLGGGQLLAVKCALLRVWPRRAETAVDALSWSSLRDSQ